MIRIVAGSLGGRRIRVPRGIRPTTERVREALFGILGPSVDGVTALDAAAGSGACGLEALSRGAARVVLVEASAPVAKVIRENVERLGVGQSVELHVVTVRRFAGAFEGERFGLVLHDPPYAPPPDPDLPLLWELLADGGVLVHERGDDADPWPGGPRPFDRRRFGETRLVLYRRPPGVDPPRTGA